MIALVVDGIILGSILSLGAVSLTLVYGIVRFANFAHGDLMAVGAYVAFFLVNTVFATLGIPIATFGPLSFGLPMLLALPLAMLVTAVVAVVVDRLVFRPMRARRYATVMFVIGSLAVAFAIRALLFIIWGPEFHFYTQALTASAEIAVRSPRKAGSNLHSACLSRYGGGTLSLLATLEDRPGAPRHGG